MHSHNSQGTSSPTNRVTEHLRQGYEATTECVVNHPESSVLVVFGVGFGLGLLLGHVLTDSPREERHGLAAFGRHVLEWMRERVPDAMVKRFPT